MQWLIDLIIETIGIPPTFIDRGNAPGVDFDQVFLDTTPGWHDLDLSAIVPAGATAVALRCNHEATVVNNALLFKRKGQVLGFNISQLICQIANGPVEADLVIPLDANRQIEYLTLFDNWFTIWLTVKGWWL